MNGESVENESEEESEEGEDSEEEDEQVGDEAGAVSREEPRAPDVALQVGLPGAKAAGSSFEDCGPVRH